MQALLPDADDTKHLSIHLPPLLTPLQPVPTM